MKRIMNFLFKKVVNHETLKTTDRVVSLLLLHSTAANIISLAVCTCASPFAPRLYQFCNSSLASGRNLMFRESFHAIWTVTFYFLSLLFPSRHARVVLYLHVTEQFTTWEWEMGHMALDGASQTRPNGRPVGLDPHSRFIGRKGGQAVYCCSAQAERAVICRISHCRHLTWQQDCKGSFDIMVK